MKWEPASAAEANLWALEILAQQRAAEKPETEPWSGWTPTVEFVEACRQRDQARMWATALENRLAQVRHRIACAHGLGDWQLHMILLIDAELDGGQ